jgi:hypothetical protein
MSKRSQLLAEFAIVVDLAVESESITAVVRKHRFMTA